MHNNKKTSEKKAMKNIIVPESYHYMNKYVLMLPYIIILSGCFLTILKTTFFGLDADEQYAITLAYRIARGNKLLRDVWEPHQTSALLPALLIRVYQFFVPSLTYLVIYLRLCGAGIRFLISFLLYRTFQKDFGKSASFYTSAVFFLTLPKWIVSPEFCNQQLWYWIVSCIFLYQYFRNNKIIHIILAGLFLSFCILCYPSCIFLFIPYFLLLYKHSKKSSLVFTITCFTSGLFFLSSLLIQLKPRELLFYTSMVLHDPSHESNVITKFISYMTVLVNSLPRIFICLLIGFIISRLVPFFKRMQSLKGLAFCTLIVASIDQFGLWLLGLMPNVHPQIHYMFLFLFGIVFYNSYRKRNINSTDDTSNVSAESIDSSMPDIVKLRHNLFSVFWIPAPIGFLAVLILTNLDILGSLVHLLPGMLASILLILSDSDCISDDTTLIKAKFAKIHSKSSPNNLYSDDPAFIKAVSAHLKMFSSFFVFLWVCLLIFADIFLLRIEWNRPANVFLTRQKALSGPVKNIYCPYMVGYEYNEESDLLTQTLPSDTGIFFVGIHFPMTYMMNSYRVCTASTISTPVYDERYLEYFEIHPDKLPEYAVIEKKFWNEEMSADNPVRKWLLDQFDWSDCKENEFIYIIPFSSNN